MKAVIILGILAVVIISGCTATGNVVENNTIEVQEAQDCGVLQANFDSLLQSYKSLEVDYDECVEFFDEYKYIETEYGHRVFLPDEIMVGELACSGSMKPTLFCGDLLLEINVTSPDDLVIGDIAIYEDGDGSVVHRIINKRLQGNGRVWEFRFRGDNNPVDDNWVEFNQIKTKVIGILYGVGIGRMSDEIVILNPF